MTYAEFMMNTADGKPDKDDSARKYDSEKDDSGKPDKSGSDKEEPINPDGDSDDRRTYADDERWYQDHCKRNGIPYP